MSMFIYLKQNYLRNSVTLTLQSIEIDKWTKYRTLCCRSCHTGNDHSLIHHQQILIRNPLKNISPYRVCLSVCNIDLNHMCSLPRRFIAAVFTSVKTCPHLKLLSKINSKAVTVFFWNGILELLSYFMELLHNCYGIDIKISYF